MKKTAKTKDDADIPPPPSKWVKMCRENRSKCNNLTDKQRAALMAQAMVMIYGNEPKVATRRR
ncbi:MAG: hypothetical protein ACKVY0_11235 [Prosthecobacter sp.]|uniref:hypothetical protein n=1 Tax=Prosthecobacter sp. TaxID=1965333 RepID=UPI0038FD578E